MSELIEKQLKVKPNFEYNKEFHDSFSYEDIKKELSYFDDGKMNAAYNAVERHIKAGKGDKVAMHWLNNDGEKSEFTYSTLSKMSNQFANVLKKQGVKKGDRVFLFLPRIPPVHVSFLGILKTGAIAGTLFAAFGHNALSDRLADSGARIVITTAELKPRIDEVWNKLPDLEKIIVVGCDGKNCKEGTSEEQICDGKKVISFHKEMAEASDEFEIAHMEEEDPAFMLYTSGTTGKSKGVVHVHKAILHEYATTKYVLDVKEDDIYWCTADPGWVTGIAYGILGPLMIGTTLIFWDGRFKPEVWYKIIQDYKVTVWYTAPTAVRLLMRDSELLKKYDMSSLRYMCSVGEPLNPEAVRWGVEHIGLPFHDNYWQTETGGIVVANYPSMPIKPGSMGRPFPGVTAAVVDGDFKVLPPGKEGSLVLKPGWPSMMRKIWNNPKKYAEYFHDDEWYITGDKAHVDEDGYFWFVGRDDDVINTAGHRVGPFEVESALVEHPAVSEAGVIGKPDDTYGEIIKAFITLNPGFKYSDELYNDIKKFIKTKLAGHAYPKEIEVVEKLPKTRSGKIMRRVLKARELGQDVGDLATMAD